MYIVYIERGRKREKKSEIKWGKRTRLGNTRDSAKFV